MSAKDFGIDADVSGNERGAERDCVEKIEPFIFIELGKFQIRMAVDLRAAHQVIWNSLEGDIVRKNVEDSHGDCPVIGVEGKEILPGGS